jgi:mycothiol system anti-sigma-R factor
MACPETARVQTYLDGELDATASAEFARHVELCAECRAALGELRDLRTVLRRDLAREQAPPALRARVLRALDEEHAAAIRQPAPRPGRAWPLRPFWLGAFSGVGAAAVMATVAFFLLTARFNGSLVDELVAAHLHSLLPDHLIAVASTDRHTVKPWFAGRTDVSPVVADFASQGYRLVGGRVDALARQRAAVLVYQHGPHLINVFSWATDQPVLPKDTTRNGYHFAFWRAGNLEYCAVSDTGWEELLGLERLLRELSGREERPQ